MEKNINMTLEVATTSKAIIDVRVNTEYFA